jgi:hypothetical protein
MERKIELSDARELNDARELDETELDTVTGGASPQLGPLVRACCKGEHFKTAILTV